MSRFYAGIGSRETPPGILSLMRQLAIDLNRDGFMLRSGGAKGADTAFEQGAGPGNAIIYRAHHATSVAIDMASKHHPAWHRCSDYTRKLHGRNCMILLGPHLNQPVNFVVCWTPGAALSGGTAMGIRIAQHCGIPVRNLADEETRAKAEAWLRSRHK